MEDMTRLNMDRLDLLPADKLLAMRIQTFTPEEVAPIFNVSTDTLRSWMQHQLIHIGIADKKERSESKYNYTIFRPHLERCIQGFLI